MRTLVRLFASFCLVCIFIEIAGCGGGSSPSSTTPPAAAPTVTTISPTKVEAGAGNTTLTVDGTGFVSTTAIQVGQTVEVTTFVSSTQVSAAIPAAQLATGALLPILALNGPSTSGSGPAVNLEVDNPAPTITGVAPTTLTTALSSATVIVTGTGFVSTTVVDIGASARPTTYMSSTQASVVLTASDLASAGTLALTAVNPTPGGGSSAAVSLAVDNPVPGTITLNPALVIAGTTTATTVTVTGSNFLPSSAVQVSGSARATTYISATQLTFQLTAADQAAAATLNVSVTNPPPGGGSATTTLTVAAPTPTPVISSVTPNQIVVGSADTTLTVLGANLTANSVVQWNGAALVTTNVNYGPSPFLNAIVPAALLASTGTGNVTVNSPTATPSLSNSLAVAVVNPPPPALTSISPASGPINTATPITLTGTGFTSNSTVEYNGTSVAATFANSTSLTVTLPASSIAIPGNGNFTVTTPAPGGGTSAPAAFTAYVPIANNSMVYDAANGLFYLSVPSSAGAPYGNSVVSVDPATGALGTPIQVGSEPDQLAITSDGKYLWVGLDGASAVRQVDLTANTAGLQFTLGGNAGVYENPGTALALAALPGSPNSVVVSSTNEFSELAIAIYDSGSVRGTPSSSFSFSSAYALQVNGSRSEVYAGSQSQYDTYTYGGSGLTPLAMATNGSYASYSANEMQIANGILYTDFGTAYDAESGSLLGTFYISGSTVATGTTTADTTLGSVFILDNPSGFFNNSAPQIQVFNISNYNLASSSTIPVNLTTNTYGETEGASRLARWGTNGLAFRTGVGFYSLRSNLVKDLSSVSADLGVTLASSGSNATGANTTYTATVTNAGPSDSTNVSLTAQIPSTGVLVSATPSAGACSTSNGVACDLGGIANGATVTVAIVVNQLTPGTASLTAQVSGSETDPNLANNQATSSPAITGSAYNPAPQIVSISPAAVRAGSTDTIVTVNGSGFTSASSVLLNGRRRWPRPAPS